METRREFVRKGAAIAGAALLAACDATAARMTRKPALIGYVGVNAPVDPARAMQDLRQGLGENGLTEGNDVVIRWSWDEGRGHPWAKEQTAAFVNDGADVIVVAGTLWRSAREVTSSTPIVMLNGNGEELLARRWASSLAEPGGNITGLTVVPNQAYQKRLEYFTRVAPGRRRLALMTNFDSAARSEEESRAKAQEFGFETLIQDVRKEADVGPAFARAIAWGADALSGEDLSPTSLLSGPVTSGALRHRLPSIFPNASYVEAGGLMFYGAVYPDGYVHRRAAWYVARILGGTQPGKLPIELPTGVRFVVNGRTLRQLELMVPSELAMQVTKWID